MTKGFTEYLGAGFFRHAFAVSTVSQRPLLTRIMAVAFAATGRCAGLRINGAGGVARRRGVAVARASSVRRATQVSAVPTAFHATMPRLFVPFGCSSRGLINIPCGAPLVRGRATPLGLVRQFGQRSAAPQHCAAAAPSLAMRVVPAGLGGRALGLACAASSRSLAGLRAPGLAVARHSVRVSAAAARAHAWRRATPAAAGGRSARMATPAASTAATAAAREGSPRAVAVWLIGCAGMTLAMIVIGGATRLTRSGLSMVDWRPQGSALPSTDEEWQREFDKYKAFPECVACVSSSPWLRAGADAVAFVARCAADSSG